jgi:hypothetical protein
MSGSRPGTWDDSNSHRSGPNTLGRTRYESRATIEQSVEVFTGVSGEPEATYRSRMVRYDLATNYDEGIPAGS